jgi:hypothetical protein
MSTTTTTPVCPIDELCACRQMDDDPTFYEKYGRYSWDTEESIGYLPVTVGNHSTKVWNYKSAEKRRKSIALLTKIYELEELLKQTCRELLELCTDEDYSLLIRNYKTKYSQRFQENPSRYVSYDNPDFIRKGLQLFVDTTHTFQELDPSEERFQAVNKPKTVNFDKERNSLGDDQKLRSLHRHIVIKLNNSDNYILCLLIHELAHTPPNHVCFRTDDHKHDFRIFQALFLSIAKKHNKITRSIFI